ncbi:MAG: hypothetical protein ACQESF_01175 [Nanobdellota archaeon]
MKEIMFAGILALIFYWFISTRYNKPKNNEFKEYYDHIINSDKYKVKGKFETK